MKFILEKRNMTASQLSRKAGVPKQVISDWLGGASPRKLEQLKRVSDALETTIDELCFESNTENIVENLNNDLNLKIGDQWVSGVFEVKVRRLRK